MGNRAQNYQGSVTCPTGERWSAAGTYCLLSQRNYDTSLYHCNAPGETPTLINNCACNQNPPGVPDTCASGGNAYRRPSNSLNPSSSWNPSISTPVSYNESRTVASKFRFRQQTLWFNIYDV